MIRDVVVRAAAKQDLREARAWYRNISSDLANDFLHRVEEAIGLIRERPLAFPIVHRTFRRILLRRFPYSLFYHVAESRIVIVAILHQARDPEIIESRHL